jgi:cysteinyl-tRNA synthetase
MSMKFLGETFDIHGGGKDLVFPHHENEIAQSEAANGQQFVRYWIHNGFVNIDSEKMSKSLGNFFTIKDVLKKYDSEVLRFFLLSAHYRSPIDFCDQNLSDAESGLERIYKALAGIDAALAKQPHATSLPATEVANDLSAKIEAFPLRFREAMDDDFNTALALGNLFELVRAANRMLTETEALGETHMAILRDARSRISEAGGVLGLFNSEPTAYLDRIKGQKVADMQISPEQIEKLVLERSEARKARNFKRSDEIRDYLLTIDVVLLDGPQGTTWEIK